MGKYSIVGGKPLKGELYIQGSKNAVLPILAATILNKGKSYIYNCPKIVDVSNMIKILEAIGCIVTWQDRVLIVDASILTTDKIPENLVQTMRSSIIVLGSVLARLKCVTISFPGGCSIGLRPINLHIQALKQMNVNFTEDKGLLICESKDIKGTDIHFDYPSVGATENVMLAATISQGVTRIYNAAKEPEILELQNFLNKAGAKIWGAGTDCITIEGVKELHEVHYEVMPDRIVAGTYLTAAAITGGELYLKNIQKDTIDSICSKLKQMGCKIESDTSKKGIYLKSPRTLKAIDQVITQPYPGFPTDMQAQLMSCLTISDGTSVLKETIFESRFKHVPELIKMGANIITEGRVAIIKGVKKLHGAEVYAEDLRGGAALVLAGLAAEGETTVHNACHVLRGYESIETFISDCGGQIKYIED